MSRWIEKLIAMGMGGGLLKSDTVLIQKGLKRTIFIQAISSIIVFGSSIFFVHYASVAEYGIYVHVFNWINVLMVIACFGMEDVVLAEIPIFLKRNEPKNIVALIVQANKWILFISIILCLLFSALVFSGLVKALYEYRTLFLIALVNIYLIAFITVNQQALQAFNRFYSSQLSDKVIKPLLILAIVCVFFAVFKIVDARVLIYANTLALLLSAIMVFFLLRKEIKNYESGDAIPMFNSARLVKAVYFLLISLIILLKGRIGMLILGGLKGTESVGIFNIAYRLSDLVFLPFVLMHAVVPQLFAHHFDTNKNYTKSLFNKITLITSMGSLLVFLFILFLGKMILGIYDVSLIKYYDILIILCVSQFLYSLFGPSSAILMMHKKHRLAAFISLTDVVLSFVLQYFLTQSFGLVGAAWGTLAGSFTYNLMLRWAVKAHLAA